MHVMREVTHAIRHLSEWLLGKQEKDGTWKFCYDNGISTCAYLIIVLRTLETGNSEEEEIIRRLHDSILRTQRPDGSWKLYADEKEGNLAASVEAYYALLFSGYSDESSPSLVNARTFIRSRGGIGGVTNVLTRVILAATGRIPWPEEYAIPLEFMLLPESAPLSFFDLSAYARVHLVPVLLMADRNFSVRTSRTPDLSALHVQRDDDGTSVGAYASAPGSYAQPGRGPGGLLADIQEGIAQLSAFPSQLHECAVKKAERFMLERIEPDGTLYSYAGSTCLLVFALLSLGCERRHPLITQAVKGLKAMLWVSEGRLLVQNAPPTVWDTALITYALQEAGIGPLTPEIRKAASYLLAKQQRKIGDWGRKVSRSVPGGWGFSPSNTRNPDVDDTTAALRAVKFLRTGGADGRETWNRGLYWIMTMQNKDGGWAAFEKDTDNRLLAFLPLEGAEHAAVDPSTADLTGRTLEFLGGKAGLDIKHDWIRRGADWLTANQEKDGSWYGRWGICYLYGTWAALTGLAAVGLKPDHPAVAKGIRWLLSVQNPDGGWGESCSSDVAGRYVSLGASTPSQTAWALDALIAVHSRPTEAIDRGVRRLAATLGERDWTSVYPTGAGLPGSFYNTYESYRYIWPLLALSHYRNKYGEVSAKFE
ncbi:prenyltransferase/squalene oxidase repeat-containing protein [Paenibacillus sp. UNC499MF]|uniref:terpene cyclase/mutase family protein n=1 Tax=Paenibacillus sp. UNC499MF TaxID=1502751 RepID=UPI0008A07E09|nr:prenyltransferase/squalene oxidase repeat-containing protein [Paenibacillus sp. UNC499MF]SEG45898.1 sporulenol synthase [Paenibacillus sp. UNC499MF]